MTRNKNEKTENYIKPSEKNKIFDFEHSLRANLLVDLIPAIHDLIK